MTNSPPAPVCKIDWYSFTLPLVSPLPARTGVDVLGDINVQLRSLSCDWLDSLSADGTWRLDKAKGFYSFRATHLTSGLSVSWGDVNAHLFVELPGSACDFVRAVGDFPALIRATCGRASRIDAAIDLRTGCSPRAFVAGGFAKRFGNSHGHVVSEQGETVYVGNRKSDRSARVYRYNRPHPRAHLLRVEAEYHGKAARALAEVLRDLGEVEAVRRAHRAFEWKNKELDERFLQSANWKRDLATSRGMGNIAGLICLSFPPSSDTSRSIWLTLGGGWMKWYLRRWRPHLVPDF